MNGVSNRGGAFGFKLSDIEKVAELKSNDKKKNLMCYVINNIEKQTNSQFIDLNYDISGYDICQKMQISQLKLNLQDLKNGKNEIF